MALLTTPSGLLFHYFFNTTHTYTRLRAIIKVASALCFGQLPLIPNPYSHPTTNPTDPTPRFASQAARWCPLHTLSSRLGAGKVASVGVLEHVAGKGRSRKAIRGWWVAGGGGGSGSGNGLMGQRGRRLLLRLQISVHVCSILYMCVCVCGSVHLFVGGGVGLWRRTGAWMFE